MRFTPRTEAECSKLFPKGTYDAEVIKAEPAISRESRREMIKVTLKVYFTDDSRPPIFVHDYLMEAMAAKLRHFCESGSVLETYEAGELVAESCVGLSVRVKLKIEEGGQYPDKNVVQDYVPPRKEKREPSGTGRTGAQEAALNKGLQEAAVEAGEGVPPSDDIPF